MCSKPLIYSSKNSSFGWPLYFWQCLKDHVMLGIKPRASACAPTLWVLFQAFSLCVLVCWTRSTLFSFWKYNHFSPFLEMPTVLCPFFSDQWEEDVIWKYGPQQKTAWNLSKDEWLEPMSVKLHCKVLWFLINNCRMVGQIAYPHDTFEGKMGMTVSLPLVHYKNLVYTRGINQRLVWSKSLINCFFLFFQPSYIFLYWKVWHILKGTKSLWYKLPETMTIHLAGFCFLLYKTWWPDF